MSLHFYSIACAAHVDLALSFFSFVGVFVGFVVGVVVVVVAVVVVVVVVAEVVGFMSVVTFVEEVVVVFVFKSTKSSFQSEQNELLPINHANIKPIQTNLAQFKPLATTGSRRQHVTHRLRVCEKHNQIYSNEFWLEPIFVISF